MDNNELDNKPRNSGNGGFGSYWIYGLIALVLIGFNAYQWGSTEKKDIEWQKYELMLKEGDVQKVTVVNEKQLHIFLKEDRLSKHGLAKSKFPNRPNFYLEIPAKVYEERMKDFYKSNPTVAPIFSDFEEQPNFLGPLLNWLVLIALMIGLWVFIMRRVGGGAGGPGGQIFNIGRSKAQLFDSKDGKVNINFSDVAGLDEAKEEVMEDRKSVV